MAAIGNVFLVQAIDKLTATYLETSPSILSGATSSTTPGFGDSSIAIGGGTDYGRQLKLRDIQTLILGGGSTADPDRVNRLFTAIQATIQQNNMQKQEPILLQQLFQALAADISAAGISVTTIDGFLSYYNTGGGGNWQALASPDFRTLHNLMLGQYPNALNVYAPPLISTPGLGSYSGSFTAGAAADTTKYAGFTQLYLVVTSGFTGGPGSIVLSGNGFTANGTANAPTPFTGTYSAHQLTYTVSGASLATGVYKLTPANNADIFTSITGVQLNSVSGGAFWVCGIGPTAMPSGGPSGTGTSSPTGTTRNSPPS